MGGIASAVPVVNWGFDISAGTNYTTATMTGGATNSIALTRTPTLTNVAVRAQLPATYTLAVGDSISLTGTLTVIAPATSGDLFGNIQHRFALLNTNTAAIGTLGGNVWAGGANPSSGYLGYYFTPGNTTNSQTVFRRGGTGTNSWFSGTGGGAAVTNTAVGNAVATTAGNYVATIQLTRTGSGQITGVTSLVQTSGGTYSNVANWVDSAANNFVFNSAGVLFGGSTVLSNAQLNDVQINYVAIPEAGAFLCGSAAAVLVGLIAARRRS